MRQIFTALLIGALFGAGLAISGMVDPARVQNFLDVTGSWDPTLAFVLGGAIVPSAIAYRIRKHMQRPLLVDHFAVPENRLIDRPLLAGAALFGIGWGLVGFCPGPALAALALGYWQPWLFTAAMLAGMAIHAAAANRSSGRHTLQAEPKG